MLPGSPDSAILGSGFRYNGFESWKIDSTQTRQLFYSYGRYE